MVTAGAVIELTGKTTSAFYVGSCADVCAATLFGLVLFINRKKPADHKSSSVSMTTRKCEHDEERDSGVDNDDEVKKENL